MGGGPLLYFAYVFHTHSERIFCLSVNLNNLVAPVVENMGIELYDLEFVKEGGVKVLRLFIDKEGGVNLNDCENVSRAVEAELDKHDPIPTSYRLQVGSPGVERKLTKTEHFSKHINKKVTVKLFSPQKISETISQKTFIGFLQAYDENKLSLKDLNGQIFCFPVNQIASCRLLVFEDESQVPKKKSVDSKSLCFPKENTQKTDKKRRTRDNG